MPKETIHSTIKGIPHLNEQQYPLTITRAYETLFVIGDIHGFIKPFKTLLEHFTPENNEILILNGDLIDKGLHSLKVLNTVYKLKQKYPTQVYLLLGNHENLFIKFLKDPIGIAPVYFNAGGSETLKSFGYDTKKQSPKAIVKDFKKAYPHFIDMLMDASIYFEDVYDTGVNIIVHAGVNLKQLNENRITVRDHAAHTTPLEYLTIRDDFHEHPVKQANIRFFVGHTPTRFLHANKRSDALFIDDQNQKVAMDGGVHKDGQLNAVKITKDTYTVYASSAKR